MSDSSTLHLSSMPLDRQSLSRKMIFVSGKGGVGKTAVSQALAQSLAKAGFNTLWATFADPLLARGEKQPISPRLTHLNCDPTLSFEEYATLKIGESKVAQFFIKNRLMRYLAEAAPGFHELVLLGKVWFERNHFDVVVCDMPSTGYGLTMFQATQNFAELFAGSPIQSDAEAMTRTFSSAKESLHLIVALPEEMPLQEGLELGELLKKIFPQNPAGYLINRNFPAPGAMPEPSESDSPVTQSMEDYLHHRVALESKNRRLWADRGLQFSSLLYVSPDLDLRDELATAIGQWIGTEP